MWVTLENREKFEIPSVTVFSSWAKVPGTAFWNDEPSVCNDCCGDGRIIPSTWAPDPINTICTWCYGTGWVAKDRDNPELKGSDEKDSKSIQT